MWTLMGEETGRTASKGDEIRPSIMTQRLLSLLTGKGPDQRLQQGQGQGQITPLPHPDFPIVTTLLL